MKPVVNQWQEDATKRIDALLSRCYAQGYSIKVYLDPKSKRRPRYVCEIDWVCHNHSEYEGATVEELIKAIEAISRPIVVPFRFAPPSLN